MAKSARLERYLNTIKKSENDADVIREILEKYKKDILDAKKRLTSTKNKFIQFCCKQDIEELEKEYHEIDDLI